MRSFPGWPFAKTVEILLMRGLFNEKFHNILRRCIAYKGVLRIRVGQLRKVKLLSSCPLYEDILKVKKNMCSKIKSYVEISHIVY